MNVRTEELPGCRLKIWLSFDGNEVKSSFDRVYSELNSRGQVKGFRPGKAPRALLARHYGEDSIANSAKYELLESKLEEAIEGFDMLGQPELPDIEDMEFVEGQPAEFEIMANVGPRVKLGELEGLTLKRPAPEAAPEDVERVLEQLRETHAEEVEVDRDVVKEGDVVDLMLTVKLSDVDEEMDEIEQSIIVGHGTNFPPVDDKLPGHIVGQSVEVDATYPDDYHDESLAGKDAHITAKIVAVRERKLPELDDEFAKKLDEEKFATFDDLKTEIKRQLDEERASYSRGELENQVVKALLESSEVEVPDVLVHSLQQQEMQSLASELEQMKMGLSEFRDMTGVSEEDFDRAQESRARRQVEIQALIDEVSKDYEEPSEEALEAELELFAAEQNMDLNFLKQAASIQADFNARLADRIRRRKVFDSIIEAADLQDMPVEEYREIREDLLKLTGEEAEEADTEETAEAVADSENETTEADPEAVADEEATEPEA